MIKLLRIVGVVALWVIGLCVLGWATHRRR